jgi:uncharacterized protein YabE (DUF348 family)
LYNFLCTRIVDKEEIPYETKREFDKDLAPGTEKVVQKGENGEKTITTPTTKNHNVRFHPLLLL